MKKKNPTPPSPQDNLVSERILSIRGQKVILDRDLAELYCVETRTLKQAVKRHRSRFPRDFMFDLTQREWQNLRSQIVISSWGGIRYLPTAFTEQGVAMLSGVLNSKKAIAINIRIMRVFVKMRQLTYQYRNLLRRMEKIEASDENQNQELQKVIDQLAEIMNPSSGALAPIGFRIGPDLV